MENNDITKQEQTASEQHVEEQSVENTLDTLTEQTSDSQNPAEETSQEGNSETKGEKAKRIAKKYAKRYFIDAFTGMAQGLFCTLIAGTIISQIGSWCGDNAFARVLIYIGSIAKMLMGAGIGVGIAHKLGAKPLVIFTAAAAVTQVSTIAMTAMNTVFSSQRMAAGTALSMSSSMELTPISFSIFSSSAALETPLCLGVKLLLIIMLFYN